MTRRIWEKTGRTRGKKGTRWILAFREMRIREEGKKNRGNKYTPTNVQELNDREAYAIMYHASAHDAHAI